MDLPQHYRQLASFDEWANLEVIAALRNAGHPIERSLKFIAHIVAAEYLWLTRIQQRPSPYAVWPELTLEECGREVPVLANSWKGLLSQFDILDRKIHYKNSKGEEYNSLVRDILTHVFMHSTYHRGQIAADMRQNGFFPAYTDFIHAVRQGFVE
jgi:uncharacterized damage-inducible protein DinB